MDDFVMSAFARAAHSARDTDFPKLARQRAVDGISDCVACQVLGSSEPLAAMILATIPTAPQALGPLSARLVGTSLFTDPTNAALYGGAVAHAADFDDTNHPAYAHPSAVIVPAMQAIAPLVSASGSDMVTAYIIAFDLIGKLGRTLNTAHYERGWHTTKTFGVLAGALAAGRLLRLPTEKLETALAIAASSASGLRGNFGTMTKPLHAGQAAQAGVSAALLAQAGLTASRDIFEHRYGYLGLMAGGASWSAETLRRPFEPLEILTPHGLALKPYPSCGATHPAIEAASLLSANLFDHSIGKVRVGVSRLSFAPLIYDRPDNPLEGKFSMQYCVAAALLHGGVSLATFAKDALVDPAVRAVMASMIVEVDDRVADSGEFGAVVTVERSDGVVLEERVDLAKGKPERWFTENEMRSKFLDCAAPALGELNALTAFERLRALDTVTPATWFTTGLISGQRQKAS